MSTTFRSRFALLLWLSRLALATFTSPGEGASWDLTSSHQIQWDTTGLQGPLQMHLASGGAKDLSTVISELAPSIPNTGSWVWLPQPSIPQHSSYAIIIIDIGGNKTYSPPFEMIGWPAQEYTSAALYTPPAHTSVAVYTPPAHTTSVLAHTAPPLLTAVTPEYTTSLAHVPPPVHTVMPVHNTSTALLQHTSILTTEVLAHTSVLSTELLVHTSIALLTSESQLVHTPPPHVIQETLTSELLVTSHLAPIIKTIEQPPIVQTHEIAPIIVTQQPAPLTKIFPQAPIITTETLAPITKTLLVTETPAPIVKNISQPALTVIETLAPVLITQVQQPVVTTIVQPPQIVTEELAPVVITEQVLHTIDQTSTEAAISVTEEFTKTLEHTVVQSTHTSIIETLSSLHSISTAVETFATLTSAEIPVETTTAAETTLESLTFALPVTTRASSFATSFSLGGAAASSGFGVPPVAFQGSVGRITFSSVVLGSLAGMVALLLL